MGKWKPFLVTAVVSIIAVEVWSRYLRGLIFK
jgi:hypothetical protein